MAKPQLPKLLLSKIYKTGQTRGADDDQIFQNRVGRNSTALVPFNVFAADPFAWSLDFEKGLIILIKPEEYFENSSTAQLDALNLEMGRNCLIFYETRDEWNRWNPIKRKLKAATSRQTPLGGKFVARIANTTSNSDSKINEGFTTTGMKGAGISGYEYCSSADIVSCRIQLQALFWHTLDYELALISTGMNKGDIQGLRSKSISEADDFGLLDFAKLQSNRILNSSNSLVCPLCLEEISAQGFLNRMQQAEGREVHDLTITEVNLFHIQELRFGKFNHGPYNLGWGHHHCNVVCKDTGIASTIKWMEGVLKRNQIIN